LPTQEMHGRPGASMKAVRVLAAADDHQPPPQPVARRDGQFQPLVRSKGRYRQVVILAADRCGTEEIRIDRRVDDGSGTAGTLQDAALDRSTDGDKMRYARGRPLIPSAEHG